MVFEVYETSLCNGSISHNSYCFHQLTSHSYHRLTKWYSYKQETNLLYAKGVQYLGSSPHDYLLIAILPFWVLWTLTLPLYQVMFGDGDPVTTHRKTIFLRTFVVSFSNLAVIVGAENDRKNSITSCANHHMSIIKCLKDWIKFFML